MTESSKKTIACLYSDDQLFRYGLVAYCSDKLASLQINVEQAEDSLLQRLSDPSIVKLLLLDLIVDGQFTIGLIERVRSLRGDLAILVVSRQSEIACAERCLIAGANGYLNPSTNLKELETAVEQVSAGEIYLSQRMQNRLLTGKGNRTGSIGGLTSRELDVFHLLGRGKSTREIAGVLELSVKTVETYREKLKQKLKFRSSHELIRFALEASVFRFEEPHPGNTLRPHTSSGVRKDGD